MVLSWVLVKVILLYTTLVRCYCIQLRVTLIQRLMPIPLVIPKPLSISVQSLKLHMTCESISTLHNTSPYATTMDTSNVLCCPSSPYLAATHLFPIAMTICPMRLDLMCPTYTPQNLIGLWRANCIPLNKNGIWTHLMNYYTKIPLLIPTY